MKAILVREYGGPNGLVLEETPTPTAGPGQVLVRIHAASYNPIDSKLASGAARDFMPLTFPWIPGADFSGVVETIGQGVDELSVGDEVYGFSPPGGAYAEAIAVGANTIAPKPLSLTYVDAASIGVVGQTAFQALELADLKSGQTILIHGASGAVGSLAVQLAHHRGARVIASASKENFDRLREYGADEIIDYKTTPFESVAKDVDAVLDTVGGETQQRSFAVLKPGGILVALSQPPSQDEAAKHNVRAVMLNTQPLSGDLAVLAAYVDSGELKPFVGKTYPFAEAPKAWADIASQPTPGKVVFIVTA